MVVTASQEKEALILKLNGLASEMAQKADKIHNTKGKKGEGGQVLAGLIFALQQLVQTFTGTMQVFQERFGQLSDREAQLAATLKQIKTTGTSTKDQQKFQKQILEYKQQLNAVQNQQQLSSVAMQGASSNESTMLTMLGNVVKIYGGTLVSVAQAMSS